MSRVPLELIALIEDCGRRSGEKTSLMPVYSTDHELASAFKGRTQNLGENPSVKVSHSGFLTCGGANRTLPLFLKFFLSLLVGSASRWAPS